MSNRILRIIITSALSVLLACAVMIVTAVTSMGLFDEKGPVKYLPALYAMKPIGCDRESEGAAAIAITKDNDALIKHFDPDNPSDNPTNYDYAKPVVESTQVDDSYFADALFLGDSRTVGFSMYGGLKSTYYAKVALNINGALHTKFIEEGGESLTILEAVKKHPDYKKVYICFGLNELGWPNANKFINSYMYLIDQLREMMPYTTIYVQSLIPVSDAVSSKGQNGVTNARIDLYNEMLLKMCEEKNTFYLDTAESFKTESGSLVSGVSSDGIHLNKTASQKLAAYLKTHTVDSDLAAADLTIFYGGTK